MVSAGGSVVKNVAGYDLCKLLHRLAGTLGILSRLTFKVLPKPRVWGYAGVSARDAATVEALIAGVQESAHRPRGPGTRERTRLGGGIRFDAPPDRLLAFFAFAGEEEAVAWQQSALEKLAAGADLRAYTLPELHAEVWFRAVRDFPARPGLLLRLAVRSRTPPRWPSRWRISAAGWGLAVDVAAHAANGVLWARLPEAPGERLPDIIAALRAAAAKRGGIAVVHRVPEGFAGHLERWGPPPAGFALMRGIEGIAGSGRAAKPRPLRGGNLIGLWRDLTVSSMAITETETKRERPDGRDPRPPLRRTAGVRSLRHLPVGMPDVPAAGHGSGLAARAGCTICGHWRRGVLR